MELFICPVCGEKLVLTGKSYICPKRHTFDVAKSGYVNLLLSAHSGKVHGDNKLMVNARRSFLDGGYYGRLLEGVKETVIKYYKNGDVLLDCGCGEGYYTSGVHNCLNEKFDNVNLFGIDISKTALEVASKRCSDVSFAVASVFNLPVPDKSCDMMLTMFAPYCADEYKRILKNDGIMIMVIPSQKHLWELKQAVYDMPYLNEVKEYELDGFEFISSTKVSYSIELNSKTDIQRLFSMTPYYYKTGKTEQNRLENLDFLKTTVDFEILTYKCERI